jgi:lysyl-tRNA synthetase class 2
MASITEQRIAKLDAMRTLQGHFPYRFEVSHSVAKFLAEFEDLLASGRQVSLAGRIMFRNKMGKLVFIRMDDDTGRVQWMVSREKLPPETFQLVTGNLDIGDICGVHGTAFRTKTGEPTVLVDEFVMLTKSILPLPEKFHGLKDKEVRYRQRELDLIMNRDVFETFRTRSRVLSFVRRWMDNRGFEEVETPVLQMIYGGAEAAPFKTYVNAVGTDAFLSISPELFLKRLIVGGFRKVYTLTKNFRNEGIDATHYPEFTSMESYEAFADYNDVMAMTEQLLHDLCCEIHGRAEVEYQGRPLSFALPFRRVRYFDALREKTGLHQDSPLADVLQYVSTHLAHEEIDVTLDRARLLDKIFGATVEPDLLQPTFVIDYAKESSPLCRPKRGDAGLIERFELYIMGMEAANAYSELNDPVLQRKLLTDQSRLSSQNNEIPPEPDEDFMRAIEYGLPPTGGLGVGIDRIVMFLSNAASIRDVILFPFMRQEGAGAAKKKPEGPPESAAGEGAAVAPPTLRLFHQDLYAREFVATVVDVQRNLVWLDQTAFYPTGGGQAGDVGVLNGQRVIETIPDKRNKDWIVHVLETEPPFAVGQQVKGEVAWEPRYRTMRLHSASHIMEYFLLQKPWQLTRVSTHVDAARDISKYRLDKGEEAAIPALVAETEAEVNGFIAGDRIIDLVEDDTGYRAWSCGEIREGCGGTHVKNTQEIGPVKLTCEVHGGYLTVVTGLAESTPGG